MNTRPASNTLKTLLVTVVAVLGLVGGIFAASKLMAPGGTAPETQQATYLPGGKPIAEFSLIDYDEREFDLDSLKGRWTFLFFGYTYCPDVCPMTMVTMAQAYKTIRAQTPDAKVQTVFVSVDPKRDTPERLRQFVPYYHADFIGVTGADDALTRFARNLGSVFVIHEPAPGQDHYLVDHSSAVLLISPDARLQAVFSAPQQADRMAEDFAAIYNFHRAR